MQRKTFGFTLIEIMITVAIIGILAAIAYPSYMSQVRKSRRTDAKSVLMQAANREERFYTTEHEYSSDLAALGVPTITENEAYDIVVSVSGNGNQKFVITATARGDQNKDACTAFAVNQLGQKTANGGSPSSDVSQDCW